LVREGDLIMTDLREISKSLVVAAEELEKLEVARVLLIDSLERDLIITAGRINQCADEGDMERNLINYGEVLHIEAVLTLLKINVITAVWKDRGFYRITKVTIDGKETIYPASGKEAAE
jgi:hypothetical protein